MTFKIYVSDDEVQAHDGDDDDGEDYNVLDDLKDHHHHSSVIVGQNAPW